MNELILEMNIRERLFKQGIIRYNFYKWMYLANIGLINEDNTKEYEYLLP